MRVLVTTAPLHGHYYPLVPLAWAFRSLGHNVLVATSDEFVATAAQCGLPVIGCGPGFRMEELTDNRSHPKRNPRFMHGQVFARMAQRNLHQTVELLDSWQPDLVISERAELAGPVAASALGIPHVELQWGIPELSEYRMAAEEILTPVLSRWGLTELPTPVAVLNPWPPSLRLPHTLGHFSIQNISYNGVARVTDWMFTGVKNPRICFTLGTLVPYLTKVSGGDLIRSLIDQLAKLAGELVVAVDDDIASRLQPLPASVRFAGRVPLAEILDTCDLLVHHGGQGTSLTALAAACPQVVLPAFDDQFENADAVARAGAGLTLPLDDVTAAELSDYCRQVLHEPKFRQRAEAVSAEIRQQPCPVKVAHQLLRFG